MFGVISFCWLQGQLPPEISRIKEIALFIAASVKEVSTPLSNLKLASVCKPCDLDVFRIEVGLKTADSMKMEVVSFDIPEDRLVHSQYKGFLGHL